MLLDIRGNSFSFLFHSSAMYNVLVKIFSCNVYIHWIFASFKKESDLIVRHNLYSSSQSSWERFQDGKNIGLVLQL